MVGRKILHYELLEKLGEGGMGAVWKAQDTRLRRLVALKFLNGEGMGDPKLQARLVREAQASASLEHPNICHVHGIHEQDGETFIAMAFVDGQSLADKIKQRPLPLDEALDIACQIAEGLKEAHEEGVVHRDMKPANVMLTSKGQAKIMDFGLAQVSGRSRLTKTASSLGTPLYMAPEQLEGGRVDRRADLWGLGCILYEMLTQKSPFEEEYEQAVAFSILNEEPEPVTALRSGLPTQIDSILEKALAKEPEQRYQHADDLLVDLQRLRETVKKSGAATPHSGSRLARRSRPNRWVAVAALASAALAGALGVWLLGPAAEIEPPIYRFDVPPPEGMRIRGFEVSPDGRHLAFVAQGENGAQLWLRSFDEPEARPIEGANGVDALGTPFWSPDSRFIGFFADEELKRVGIGGAPPVEIADAPSGRGGSWNEDGRIIFAPNSREGVKLLVVSDTGGESDQLDSAAPQGTRRSPQFLPDGERYLFSNRREGQIETHIASLSEPGSTAVLKRRSHAAYVTSQAGESYLLVVESGVLMAYPFDADEPGVTGDPVVLLRDLGYDNGTARGRFSFSRSGVLAHAGSERDDGERELAWIDRRGNIGEALQRGRMGEGRLSHDQNVAAIVKGGTITLLDLQDGSEYLPAPSLRSSGVKWSSDGKELIAGTFQEVVKISADGSAEPEQLISYREKYPTDWSPDGRWLLLIDFANGWHVDRDILKYRIGSPEPEVYLDTGFINNHAHFSPDGRFVAYVSNESGEDAIYVRSFPDPGAKHQVSSGGGSHPIWSRDSEELFFLAEDLSSIYAARVDTSGDRFSFEKPRKLFTLEPHIHQFDVTADGQRFLATIHRYSHSTEPKPIRVVINWDQELERLIQERR